MAKPTTFSRLKYDEQLKIAKYLRRNGKTLTENIILLDKVNPLLQIRANRTVTILTDKLILE